MKSLRTQQIVIKKNNEFWKQIDDLSFAVKNLYNAANYIVKQEFIKTSREKDCGLIDKAHWINCYELDPIMQNTDEYKNVGSSIAQQTLTLLNQNWKSFFKSIKDWNKFPNKYLGRPKMPKYLDKEKGRSVICFKNTQIKNKDGYIYFSWIPFKNMNKVFKTIKSERIYSARIIPKLPNYVFEIIYETNIPDIKSSPNRIVGIDLGVNNLMTVVNNCGESIFVINGKPLKSINHYYNSVKAKKQSELMVKNGKRNSKNINSLTIKRNNKVNDYIHKATKYVADWCVENKIDTLVCGYNVGWKQTVNIGKVNNQNFVNIPYKKIVQQLSYKCEDRGINFVEVDESYTSGTSFLDEEIPCKDFYDNTRRKHRGLFISNNGTEINADVNGAYQIIKKAFPNAFADGIQGVGLHPVIINL